MGASSWVGMTVGVAFICGVGAGVAACSKERPDVVVAFAFAFELDLGTSLIPTSRFGLSPSCSLTYLHCGTDNGSCKGVREDGLRITVGASGADRLRSVGVVGPSAAGEGDIDPQRT